MRSLSRRPRMHGNRSTANSVSMDTVACVQDATLAWQLPKDSSLSSSSSLDAAALPLLSVVTGNLLALAALTDDALNALFLLAQEPGAQFCPSTPIIANLSAFSPNSSSNPPNNARSPTAISSGNLSMRNRRSSSLATSITAVSPLLTLPPVSDSHPSNITSTAMHPHQHQSRQLISVRLHDLDNLVEVGLCSQRIVRIEPALVSVLRPTASVLQLCCNSLVHLPPHIAHLSNLTILVLARNKLSLLPDTIGHLQNLVELDVSHNLLIDLPESLFNLSKLVALNLEHNKLTSISSSIRYLNILTNLDLSDNPIRVLPAELVRLKFLRNISLRNCPLYTSITSLSITSTTIATTNTTTNTPTNAMHAMISPSSNVPSLLELSARQIYYMMATQASTNSSSNNTNTDSISLHSSSDNTSTITSLWQRKLDIFRLRQPTSTTTTTTTTTIDNSENTTPVTVKSNIVRRRKSKRRWSSTLLQSNTSNHSSNSTLSHHTSTFIRALLTHQSTLAAMPTNLSSSLKLDPILDSIPTRLLVLLSKPSQCSYCAGPLFSYIHKRYTITLRNELCVPIEWTLCRAHWGKLPPPSVLSSTKTDTLLSTTPSTAGTTSSTTIRHRFGQRRNGWQGTSMSSPPIHTSTMSTINTSPISDDGHIVRSLERMRVTALFSGSCDNSISIPSTTTTITLPTITNTSSTHSTLNTITSDAPIHPNSTKSLFSNWMKSSKPSSASFSQLHNSLQLSQHSLQKQKSHKQTLTHAANAALVAKRVVISLPAIPPLVDPLQQPTLHKLQQHVQYMQLHARQSAINRQQQQRDIGRGLPTTAANETGITKQKNSTTTSALVLALQNTIGLTRHMKRKERRRVSIPSISGYSQNTSTATTTTTTTSPSLPPLQPFSQSTTTLAGDVSYSDRNNLGSSSSTASSSSSNTIITELVDMVTDSTSVLYTSDDTLTRTNHGSTLTLVSEDQLQSSTMAYLAKRAVNDKIIDDVTDIVVPRARRQRTTEDYDDDTKGRVQIKRHSFSEAKTNPMMISSIQTTPSLWTFTDNTSNHHVSKALYSQYRRRSAPARPDQLSISLTVDAIITALPFALTSPKTI